MPNSTSNWLTSILSQAVKIGASDIHLAVGSPPIVRLIGDLHPLEGAEPITAEQINQAMKSSLLPETYVQYEKREELDFSLALPDIGRFRFAVYYKSGLPAIAARVIPTRIPTLDEIEAPEAALDFVELSQGFVLVTGPTGAGKSTLLASMVEHINQNKTDHIITLEDPIEFLYTPKKSLISQRELGIDFPTFDEALKHTFRQDPDVVLIGEMRDRETMAAALMLAETGHLVFSTLHTNGAAQTVDRIIGSFPAEQQQEIRLQLSFTLKGVISQLLIPTVDGKLTAVREVLTSTPAMQNVIRDGRTEQLQNIIYSSVQNKMVDLDRDLAALVEDGKVDVQTAYEHARNKEHFE